MRCNECQRPYLTKEQHTDLFNSVCVMFGLVAIFCAGALVEAICDFNLPSVISWLIAYTAGVGLLTVWWRIKVMD